MVLGFFSGVDMRNESIQLRVFLVSLFILAASALSTATFAAVVVTPVVGGLSRVTSIPVGLDGHIRYQGQGAWNPITRSYAASGVASVGGRALTIPAKVPLAATAGALAKAAMRANPYLLAGTLALGYLASNDVELDGQGGFTVNDTSGGTYPGGQLWRNNGAQGYTTGTAQGPYANQCGVTSGGCSIEAAAKFAVLVNVAPYGYPNTVTKIACTEAGWCQFSVQRAAPYNDVHTDNYQLVGTGVPAPSTRRPMTPEDWDGLPDPIPAVGPELPNAPYMPDGAPVNAPEYDPQSVPAGAPYTRPDGSTVQPKAQVSPAGDGQITVDLYDEPLTDPAGNPVADPQPVDTQEPPLDPCDANPGRIGCMDAGTDDFAVPRNTVNFDFTPEASPIGSGSCPAPITVLGQSLSYQPACDAMVMIRPVVLGMASVMAAFILFGAFREAV